MTSEQVTELTAVAFECYIAGLQAVLGTKTAVCAEGDGEVCGMWRMLAAVWHLIVLEYTGSR